ncbi:MAG: ThuA domain-containing protein [Planctomycetia bacterium]|nr:ThuA domain-containing protein [Planctomycetia bacterium]
MKNDHLIRAFLISLTVLFTFSMSAAIFAAEKESKKILYYDYTYRFIHQPTIDGANGEPGACAVMLKDLAGKHGYEVICTKDGSVFDGDLSPYAAFVFYTSGELNHPGGKIGAPMSEKGMKNFFEAIRSGSGFLGIHSATVNPLSDKADPDLPGAIYAKIIGARFVGHGKDQEADVKILKPGELPSLSKCGSGFRVTEEWYRMKMFTPDDHVFLVLDTKGMKGKIYECPPLPLAWARKEGKGRVAYHAFGHRNKYLNTPLVSGITGDLLEFVLGLREFDLTPNLDHSN